VILKVGERGDFKRQRCEKNQRGVRGQNNTKRMKMLNH